MAKPDTDPYGDDSAATDAVFHALASGERRRILDILKQRPGIGVQAVAAQFDMSRIGVMKHLAVLEQAGLVVSQKQGRERRLFFNAVPLQIIHERWGSDLSDYWAESLTGLQRAVELGDRRKKGQVTPWLKKRRQSFASRSGVRSKPSGKK